MLVMHVAMEVNDKKGEKVLKNRQYAPFSELFPEMGASVWYHTVIMVEMTANWPRDIVNAQNFP